MWSSSHCTIPKVSRTTLRHSSAQCVNPLHETLTEKTNHLGNINEIILPKEKKHCRAPRALSKRHDPKMFKPHEETCLMHTFSIYIQENVFPFHRWLPRFLATHFWSSRIPPTCFCFLIESCTCIQPTYCEAILFLEPKMNVRSVQHCVSGRRKRTQTLTTTDVLKTAVKIRAAC